MVGYLPWITTGGTSLSWNERTVTDSTDPIWEPFHPIENRVTIRWEQAPATDRTAMVTAVYNHTDNLVRVLGSMTLSNRAIYHIETASNYASLGMAGGFYYSQGTAASTGSMSYLRWPEITPQAAIRSEMRRRLRGRIVTSRRPLTPGDLRERRARETLARLVGERAYRQYVSKGFLSAPSPTQPGVVYQLFPGHRQIRVWKGGQLVETLCIVLQGDYPPTDSLIVRYLLVRTDEARLWATSNRSKVAAGRSRPVAFVPDEHRPLGELYRELMGHAPVPLAV